MRTLFLDSASREHSLALVEGQHTLLWELLPSLGDALITHLEEALRKVGMGTQEITRIACVTGPGGFASIRTAVTAANTLAYALEIPAAGVHLSEVWFARTHVSDLTSQDPLLWLHSTRKNLLFVRGLGSFADTFPEPSLLNLEDAVSLQGHYVGELLEEHKAALQGCIPLGKECIAPLEEILPALIGNLSFTKDPILPWYGREP